MTLDKIALGTVQFGLDYGINNKAGKVAKHEVFEILHAAFDAGITTLDTAKSYGESECVIGQFIQTSNKQFNIVTKITGTDIPQVKDDFDSSLRTLRSDSVYGCLLHHFDDVRKNPHLLQFLRDIKQQKKVKKTGFSLYYPRELELLFEKNISFDLVQIPYSVFDQRFNPYFAELQRRNIEIHVRSVFLQGLVFKKRSDLDSFFDPLRQKLGHLHIFAQRLNIPVHSLCLNFALHNTNIDKVLIGVDTNNNLSQNIESVKAGAQVQKILDELRDLHIDDEKIILPFNWKRS